MGTRILYQVIETDKSPEEVRQAALASHRPIGGYQQLTSEGFNIRQGINGIGQGSFVNLVASVSIRKAKENTYNLQTYLNWNASSQTIWFIFLCWPVACLYFLFDPTPNYQYALDQIRYNLDPKQQAPLFNK